MEHTYLTVRATPDALVKIYNAQDDTVLYVDNTDANGETARVPLAAGGEYYLDVTVFPDDGEH